MIAIACIVTAILGGALAQLFMKAGLRAVTTTDFQALITGLITFPKQTAFIIIGIALYGLSMLVWVYALKHFKLNQAYPLLSLGYVVVYVLSTVWPGIQESFSPQKSIGIGLIILGVWITQRSPAKE